MSVRVMSWVWDHSGAAGNDRLVLLAIADHCDDQGMNAWPKVDTLVRKTKLGERTVRRAIKRLAESGELVVVERGGRQMGSDNRGHRPHLYRVVMGAVTPRRPVMVTGQDDRSVTGQSDRSSDGGRPVILSEVTGHGDRSVTGHGDRSIKEPSEGPTVLEPSLTPASSPPGPPPDEDVQVTAEAATSAPAQNPPGPERSGISSAPGPAAAKAAATQRGAAKQARAALARNLVTDWWDERKAAGDPPAQRFVAIVGVVDGVLANGVPAEAVSWALRNVPTVSGGTIQMALSRRNGRSYDGRQNTTTNALELMRRSR